MKLEVESLHEMKEQDFLHEMRVQDFFNSRNCQGMLRYFGIECIT